MWFGAVLQFSAIHSSILNTPRHGHGESGGVDLLILMSGATSLVDGGNNIDMLVFKITLISRLPNVENN